MISDFEIVTISNRNTYCTSSFSFDNSEIPHYAKCVCFVVFCSTQNFNLKNLHSSWMSFIAHELFSSTTSLNIESFSGRFHGHILFERRTTYENFIQVKNSFYRYLWAVFKCKFVNVNIFKGTVFLNFILRPLEFHYKYLLYLIILMKTIKHCISQKFGSFTFILKSLQAAIHKRMMTYFYYSHHLFLVSWRAIKNCF